MKPVSVSSFLLKKKIKYGSFVVAMTVTFIAFVIIFNVIFSALASKYMWYIDMTATELFTLSDATFDLLRDVKADVNIIFCMDPDEVAADGMLYYVQNTAKLLAKEFKNINIIYKDAVRDYNFLKKYSTASSPEVHTTSVIVESGTEYRKYENTSFFIRDTSNPNYYWAYKGEQVLVAAILQVTAAEMPIAYFTVGHGEDTDITGDVAALYTMVYEAGYDVRPIDLSKEDIDPNARLIIINEPRFDFGGYVDESVGLSEIEKIDAFLDGLGSLMVFIDPDHGSKLTNLNEFLYEWGIEFEYDLRIKDAENSISIDGFSVVGQYNTNTTELAHSVYEQITSLASQPKTIFRNACPIKHTYEDNTRVVDFDSRVISDVFYTSDSAEVYRDSELVGTGRYSLMTITQEQRIINNNDYFSYVLATGTKNYTASQYLLSNIYANSDVLYACMRAFGKERIPADIDFKTYNDYDLDITTAQANSWTRFFMIVPATIIVITSIYVTVRRKYK